MGTRVVAFGKGLRTLWPLGKSTTVSKPETKSSPSLPSLGGMQDSVLVVALDEAKASADALAPSRLSSDLHRRIVAIEDAVSNLNAPREKAAIVRLALHALALRDEATDLRAQRRQAHAAILEMMD